MNVLGLNAFFDPDTRTLTYVVWDRRTRDAVVIDPVLNYDPATRAVSTPGLDALVTFARAQALRIGWILETHAHADHLTAARELRSARAGALWGMGARLTEVFGAFHRLGVWPAEAGVAGVGVDRWFEDGEEFTAGPLRIEAIATPGHTPACVTYRIGEWLFTGDALMMPDVGVGRCDFPGGSAAVLHDSIWRRLYAMPDHFVTFPGHDYRREGPPRHRAALSVQKDGNIHLRRSTGRAEFIAFREARDKTLTPPRLLQVSLNWNLRGVLQP
jgi:glyoxylase-like metal-dependent hydrolase (beta-lactamase superfamily II)